MPTPPYAKLLVRVNGAAPTSGAVTVANGDSIQFVYESTAFWDGSTPARLEFYSFPSGWAGPGGSWLSQTVNITVGALTYPFTVYYYLGSTPPAAFTMPAVGTWGKFLPRLLVNGGTTNGVTDATLLDESTGLEIVSPELGLHDVARFEGAQFGGAESWVKQHKENLRLIDAWIATAGTVTSVTGTPPITSTGGATPAIGISPASALTAGSQSIAHFNLVAGATAAATADKLTIRGASGEVVASWLDAGGSIYATGGIVLDATGASSITKTAGAGTGGTLTIRPANGAVGFRGGKLSIGPGIGGTPNVDEPGDMEFVMGGNGTNSGLQTWTAGSLSQILSLQYLGGGSATTLSTIKPTLMLDAATSVKLGVSSVAALTVTSALVTANDALTVTGILTASSQVIESGEVAVTLGTNQNDYSGGHTAATTIYINATAAFNLTGLTGGAAGRRLEITNGGVAAITLTHEDAASTAANRFTCPGGSAFVLAPGCTAFLKYRPSTSRWVVKVSRAHAERTVTADGSFTAADRVLLLDTNTMTTLTLAPAASVAGLEFLLANIGPSDATVNRAGSDLIQGDKTTFQIPASETMIIRARATRYEIFAYVTYGSIT